MAAYRHIWTGESLPAFTTDQAALVPVTVETTIADHVDHRNWTVETLAYSTSLDCTPNKHGRQDPLYSDGDGCDVDSASIDLSGFRALYFGYWTSQYNDFSLSGFDGCSAMSNAHKFFALWQDPSSNVSEPVILFCKPSYWQQKVQATILAKNGSLLLSKPLEERKSVPLDLINQTNFEYVINAGSPRVSKRADIIDTYAYINSQWRLQSAMGLAMSPRTQLMDIGLAVTQFDLKDYASQEVLARSMEKAHQLLFALATQSLLTQDASNQTARTGVETYRVRAMVAIRPIVIVLEIVLAIIACLMFSMLIIYHSRPNHLLSDPATVLDVLRMTHKQAEQAAGSYNEKSLSNARSVKAKLDNNSITLEVLPSSPGMAQHVCNVKRRKTSVCEACPSSLASGGQSWETRILTGLIFAAVLTSVLVVLTVLWIIIKERHGLPLPSRNSALNEMLVSYLPVAFGTLLEPFWTLLNRILCVLQPIDVLTKRAMPISRSIELRYTSLPPQLTFWRALKARNSFLAIVCAVGLSTNVLSVALGGLLSSQPTTRTMPLHLPQQLSPQFREVSNDTTQKADPGIWIVTASSITEPSTLPPWTSNETFFLPFELPGGRASADNRSFTANTLGYSIGVECYPTEYNSTTYARLAASQQEAPHVHLRGGQSCRNPMLGTFGGHSDKISASEEVKQLLDMDMESTTSCRNAFLAHFHRGNLSTSSDIAKTDNNNFGGVEETPRILNVNTLDSTWMVCEQRLDVATYLVTVDDGGRIQRAVRQQRFGDDLSSLFSSGLNQTYFLNRTGSVFNSDNVAPYWHNDTYVDNWFGYLIKLLNPAATDPQQPVPTFESASPLVKSVLQRIFAVQLGLNSHWLAPSQSRTFLSGSMGVNEERVGISKPSFVICITLLSINLLACCLYYHERRHRMLSQVPVTIGSILRLFEGSSLASHTWSAKPAPAEMKIRYGRYNGVDGRPHLGIDDAAVVVGI